MNEMELVYIVLTLIGFISTIIVTIAWIVRNALRSKTGKIIDSAKAQKKPLVLSASPGHHAILLKVQSFIPGVLETSKFAQRISKKRRVFFTPKRMEVQLTDQDVPDKKSRELTQECLQNMLDLNANKVFLEDGVPVTLALEDKVITTGVKGIGALAFYEKLCKIDAIKGKIEVLKNNNIFNEVGLYLEALASKVSLINIEVLRNYFDSDWDQSDEESKNEFYYMQGYRDGQKKEKGIEKMIVLGGIGIGVAGMVGGLVFAYLSKG